MLPTHPLCPGIRVTDLSLRYGGRMIFENLNFEVAGGQFVVLLGPSGVGKTSLLKIIAGLETPHSGHCTATDGQPLAKRIAYMGQTDLLYPWLRVLDNVMLGAKLRGARPEPDRAMQLLARVGLADRASALPAELSGGMKQRAAIARTLYEQRPIVLMDEPFSALDSITRARIQDLAAELLAGSTVLLITHDPLEACRLGHHLMVLSGLPARLGTPIAVPGSPPRATDDPLLLQTQGHLLRALAAMAPV
jgi:putative hydroxymethylpyrimidine transport system ATP-binding protein